MRIEDVVLVATVREEIRVRKPGVDTDDITSRIKAIQARILTHEASDDDSENGAESEAGEKESPKDAATTEANSHVGTKDVAPARYKEVDENGNNKHLVSPSVLNSL
jgi:hypothetical protein